VAKLVKQTRTPEQREGIERLEITHAVLAPLVVRGGKEREERRLTEEVERRRRHRVGIALGCVSVLLLFAVGALWFALKEEKQADKAAARTRIEDGRSLIEGAKLNSARVRSRRSFCRRSDGRSGALV
jgi:hypothetical protein